MDSDEITAALEALAGELRRQRVNAKIYIVGGAAMVLAFHARTSTADIDAGVYPPEKVLAAADEVGLRLGLPKGWLNDQAKIYLSGLGPNRWLPVLHWDSLEVVAADERTMLALKLRASRGRRDEGDIRFLIKRLGLHSTSAVIDLYDEFFPEDPLSARGLRILDSIVGDSPEST